MNNQQTNMTRKLTLVTVAIGAKTRSVFVIADIDSRGKSIVNKAKLDKHLTILNGGEIPRGTPISYNANFC